MPHLHTCVISYNRLELTKQTIYSYLKTVTLPYSLIVVDNASDEATCEWLMEDGAKNGYKVVFLAVNRFPGYACNRGWEQMPEETTLLHRSDNDFRYLHGWCDQVLERFRDIRVGQVGLRTAAEELRAPNNVGGNNVIRRELWEEGLRYDERPWGDQYPPGWTEDSLFSPAVVEMGYRWKRVRRPSIAPLSQEDPNDPYYKETWRLRGINQ